MKNMNLTRLLNSLNRQRGARWIALAGVGALAALLLPMPVAAQPPALSEGLVCTKSTSLTKGYATFLLTTGTFYIKTPDGNNSFMWGYANGNGSFQYPGPVLCMNEGDNVTITLKNTLPFPTSLVFPGNTRIRANGKLEQLDTSTNGLTQAVAAGSATAPKSITYTFKATNPGTYLYESGTDPEVQVLMGMVGAIVVRPRLNPNDLANPTSCASLSKAGTLPAGSIYAPGEALVYDDCASAYNPNREFMHLLTEVDPHMHVAIEKATCADVAPVDKPNCALSAPTYDMTKYVPRYWFINGRAFPDDITPNNSTALPRQPYGALVHVLPKTAQPLPALVRFLNAGPVNYPFHPHSNHDSAIGIDGRVLINPTGGQGGTPASTSFDRFGFVVAPGQTSEALFNWVDAQQWDPQNNPIGVTEPGPQNRTDGPYWSGSPYLGVKLPLLNGITQWNQCGEYYHFAHSHALFQVTNYGVPGGGMLTLIRVDPPPDVQKKYGQNCNGGPGY